MKQIFTSILIVAALVGCGTNDKKDQPVTNGNSKVVLPQPYAPVSGTLPSANQVVTSTPTNPTAVNTTSQATGALNPAHGQPGHKCELAVGAPLNSAPKPATVTSSTPGTTTTVSQPVFTTTGNNAPTMNFTPTTTAKTVTAPGMNPAHGEPGHVCGTPVGSPLNGKPTIGAATTNPITNPATPTIKMEQAPTTKVATAPGMNPPHGEPGHVCGTPVGSPLNGKTAATKAALTPSIVKAADTSRNK